MQGRRVARVTAPRGALCMDVADGADKALVGVFQEPDALEGCSRLTRPGQTERLLDFSESDNCAWAPTRREFSGE